jgi:glycosyltransferase involved in cell wall biosynthesis
MADLALAQHRLGHAVTVDTSRTAGPCSGNFPAYLDELREEGVALVVTDSLFHRDFDANLAVARRVGGLYGAGLEPDVIHTHAAVPTFIGRLFLGSRSASSPIVQTMHGWGVSKTVSQAAWDIALMNLADRVAVPSAHSAELLASRGLPWAKLTVVPYGTRPASPDPDQEDRETIEAMRDAGQRGRLVLACVGTIGPRKNQRLLVEALARLSGRPAVHAVFIGDGDGSELRRLIADADLSDVHVRGYSAAGRRLAAAADALVLPSRSEGQPLAILEAFQDGTIVIASDIPELRELVDDGVTD